MVVLSTFGFTSIWAAMSSSELPFFDPAFFDLGKIVFTSTRVVAFIVDDRESDRPELSTFFIKYHGRGCADSPEYRRRKFQCPRAGVLGRRRILVHEALPELIDGEHCRRIVLSNRPLRHCSCAAKTRRAFA